MQAIGPARALTVEHGAKVRAADDASDARRASRAEPSPGPGQLRRWSIDHAPVQLQRRCHRAAGPVSTIAPRYPSPPRLCITCAQAQLTVFLPSAAAGRRAPASRPPALVSGRPPAPRLPRCRRRPWPPPRQIGPSSGRSSSVTRLRDVVVRK